MKKNLLTYCSFVLFILTVGLCFTSCDKDEVASTPVLESFGPCPALRGGELRFIGRNISSVEGITLQGVSEITDIVTVSDEEIKITIPQEAQPGAVVLRTSSSTITTKTPLTFSEPISVSKLSNTNATGVARYGDNFTIEGDYLNLIKQVIFADNDTVYQKNFVSQTRSKIVVVVPKSARTGMITLSNGAEMPILVYTAEVPIQAPYIVKASDNLGAGLSPLTVKPVTDKVTIKGSNFDLVKAVVFGGTKLSPKFTVSTDARTIEAEVPADAQDGSVILVGFSGTTVTSELSLTMKMPVVTKVAPNPVKNGETLTISGTDLDLVNGVRFGTLVADITSQSSTELKVAVPFTATEGKVVLSTKSTKTLETENITYVKSAASSFTPLSLMAGNEVVINGSNLDLVSSVIFPNGLSVAVDASKRTATSIRINVPVTAVSGKVTLVMMNGYTQESETSLTVEPADLPIVTVKPASVKPGELLILEGMNLNVETAYFGNIKATEYGIRSNSRLEVYVPKSVPAGSVVLTLTGTNGKSSTVNITIAGGLIPVANPALIFFDFEADASAIGWKDIGSIEEDASMAISGKYYHVNATLDGGWKVYFMRNWGTFSTTGVDASTYAVRMDINIVSVDAPIVLKFRMKGSDDDFWYVWKVGELYPSGTKGWVTVTLPLTGFKNNNGDGTSAISDPSKLGSEYGIAHGWGAGQINMYIDNVRFEKM